MQSRSLGVGDLDVICQQREQMFREAGRDDATLALMTASFRVWLKPRLLDQRYFGFLLTRQEQVIAGIGLMAIDWPPHPSHPLQDQRGYVLNVYVETAYRRQGIAQHLMQLAEEEFARRGLQFAILHATQMGRPLYEGLGWNATTEMAKTLPAAPASTNNKDQPA